MAIVSAAIEVLTWREGEVYLWTGNSTTSARISYARDITVRMGKVTYDYRSPYAAARTYIELDRFGTLAHSMDFSDKTVLAFVAAGTGGAYHAHLPYSGGAGSGGVYLWTGILEAAEMRGSEGGVAGIAINGKFENWSAY